MQQIRARTIFLVVTMVTLIRANRPLPVLSIPYSKSLDIYCYAFNITDRY